MSSRSLALGPARRWISRRRRIFREDCWRKSKRSERSINKETKGEMESILLAFVPGFCLASSYVRPSPARILDSVDRRRASGKQKTQLPSANGSHGPSPLPRLRPFLMASVMKDFACSTASLTPLPAASSAVIAADKTQPVPCVFRD